MDRIIELSVACSRICESNVMAIDGLILFALPYGLTFADPPKEMTLLDLVRPVTIKMRFSFWFLGGGQSTLPSYVTFAIIDANKSQKYSVMIDSGLNCICTGEDGHDFNSKARFLRVDDYESLSKMALSRHPSDKVRDLLYDADDF